MWRTCSPNSLFVIKISKKGTRYLVTTKRPKSQRNVGLQDLRLESGPAQNMARPVEAVHPMMQTPIGRERYRLDQLRANGQAEHFTRIQFQRSMRREAAIPDTDGTIPSSNNRVSASSAFAAWHLNKETSMNPIFGKEIARMMQRKEAGLAFLDERDPNTRRQPWDVPAHIPPEKENCDPIVKPTAGLGTRVPPIKHAGTTRGWIFHGNTIVHFESELERHVALNLAANVRIKTMYSQYPVLPWTDAEDKSHKHICDFYVEFEDGWRCAYVVKHERKRDEMEDMIARIIANGADHVVDEVRLLTETFGNRDTAANAGFILAARKHYDEAATKSLQADLSQMHGHFRFGDLLRECIDQSSRRIAIWNLIDIGALVAPRGERITEVTWLMRAQSQ